LKFVQAEFDMRRAAITMSTALIALPALFAGAVQAQDRYGPQAEPGVTPASYAADRPMLNWPGKQPAPSEATPAQPASLPPAPPPPVAPPPASIYTPPPAPPAPAPVVRLTAPPPAPAPMAPIAPQASLRAPPPTSPPMASASLDMRPLLPAKPPVAAVVTHTPPPPSPQLARAAKPKPQPAAARPPVAVAAAAAAPAPSEPAQPPRVWNPHGPGLPAHFYSTAREFGQQPDPDPAPLPAQFFTDSAGGDLAAPPPPLSPRAVPGSQTVNSTASANTPANRARAIALDTPSPDGSSN
jgi:hypothetical protein